MHSVSVASVFITMIVALFGIYYFENVAKPPPDCSNAKISYQEFVKLHQDQCEGFSSVSICTNHYQKTFCTAKSR